MPDVTKFNTLTFDCYGTLIDWERGIHAELRPWLDRHGRRDLDDNALLETFGTIEAACEAETPGKLYPEILAEVHRRLAEKWNIKATAAEAAEFGQSVGRWPAFADSATSLQYLKRYYKLVILSNVDRASFSRSNEKLGVTFDRILTAQDIGSYKPSLRNFEYALGDLERTFGTRKGDILHTAQSIFHDVVPARSVGLATMWINRRKSVGGWGATPAPQAPGALATPDIEVASMADFVVLHQAHLRGESA
jgi:2-haloacid dehalogenase